MSSGCAVTFITSNAGKFATAREHLAPLGITLDQATLSLIEIQSSSVEEIAMHKAQQAFEALNRPVIVEDSGFYIEELNGFPGPYIKHVNETLGVRGIIHLANLTSTRKCHFKGVLVYLDVQGTPKVFTAQGDSGTIAHEPVEPQESGSWSALWRVFIPKDCSEPLAALRATEREQVFDSWAKSSVFAQFGDWIKKNEQSSAPNEISRGFFDHLDRLVAEAKITIDRPRGHRHPRFSDIIYPLDYGYLAGTHSGDGEGIDVFRGSANGSGVRGVLLTTDLGKRDVEIKVLIDCTEEEIDAAQRLLRDQFGIGGQLVRRS